MTDVTVAAPEAMGVPELTELVTDALRFLHSNSERLREISGMVFWCQCMQPRRDRHAPEALALRLLLLFWTCRCNRLFCEIFALCILDRTAVWCCLEVLVGRCSTGLFDARKRLKELYGSFEFHARGMMGKSYRHTPRAFTCSRCMQHALTFYFLSQHARRPLEQCLHSAGSVGLSACNLCSSV